MAWMQRKIVPGDDLAGLQMPEYLQLVNDIRAFQSVQRYDHVRGKLTETSDAVSQAL